MLTKMCSTHCGGYQKYTFLNTLSTAYLVQSEAKRVLYTRYCCFLGIISRAFSICISYV